MRVNSFTYSDKRSHNFEKKIDTTSKLLQISALTFWLPEEFHSFEGSRPRWLSTRTAGATAVVLGVGRVLLTLGVLLTTSAEAAQIITGTDENELKNDKISQRKTG